VKRTGSVTTPKGSIGIAAATAIGIGGMMGAGLYTLLGSAAGTTGVWLPLAFVVGGAVSFFSVYSYAHLGVRFPSRGGAAQFLVECFGDGLTAGGLNIFQFLAWVIAMALYAAGFAGYVLDLLPGDLPGWTAKPIAVGLILALVGVNLLGTRLVGRAQTVIIVFELLILGTFAAAGLSQTHVAHFEAGGGDGIIGIFFGAGLLYVCFEGFGVVANTAGDMADPRRQLPKAMYAALAIVLLVYVLVSTAVVGTLSLGSIAGAEGHVLDEAAKAVLGRVGWVAMGCAALVATASAVNATMFGDANLAFQVARDGELPRQFDRRIWLGGTGSLFAAAGLTAVFVVAFPLAAIGQMASLAFLIVYGMVSFGHLRIRHETGARTWMLVAAVALNAGLFLLLFIYTLYRGSWTTSATLLATLMISFAAEAAYRRRTGRRLRHTAPPQNDATTDSQTRRADRPAPRSAPAAGAGGHTVGERRPTHT
jgi:amino acid transporter